jgi:predicted Zn finger-like uncharacterized protein
MNTTCPKCGTTYNITEAHVGRKFRCKNCQSALQVTDAGIEYQTAPAATAGPAGGAFNFGPARDDDEDRGRRPARARRDDDDEDDDRPIRSYRRGAGDTGLTEYLTFRKFLTPVVIQLLFWLLSGLTVVAGVGLAVGVGRGVPAMPVQGILLVLLGPLLIRIYCELLILSFRLYDVFQDMSKAAQEMARNSKR